MKILWLWLVFLGIELHAMSQQSLQRSVIQKVEAPRVFWTYSTNSPIYGSPIADHEVVYVGSTDGYFYAVTLNTGREKWKVNSGAEIRSTATIDSNRIYFTNAAGSLFCLDATNGNIIWVYTRPGEKKYSLYSYADYYQSSPVCDHSVVYFGSGNGNIYAIDAGSGQEKWHFQTGGVVHATPVIKNGKLYVGSFDGFFYALSLEGKLQWKFKSVGHRYFPLGEFQGSPAIDVAQIIVGSRDYNLYAIDTGKGFCHWNLAFPKGWAIGKPVIKDKVLYVGSSDDQLFMAIDPATGKSIWKTSLQFNIFGGPEFGNGYVFIGTLMGKLFCLDEKSGHIIWTFETAAYKKNRLIYFNNDDVYREDLFGTVIQKNEDFLDMYYKLGGIFSTPVKSNDLLVFTSTDGNIYCLQLR